MDDPPTFQQRAGPADAAPRHRSTRAAAASFLCLAAPCTSSVAQTAGQAPVVLPRQRRTLSSASMSRRGFASSASAMHLIGPRLRAPRHSATFCSGRSREWMAQSEAHCCGWLLLAPAHSSTRCSGSSPAVSAASTQLAASRARGPAHRRTCCSGSSPSWRSALMHSIGTAEAPPALSQRCAMSPLDRPCAARSMRAAFRHGSFA
jgi:hypothetical protein